jgi:hypothetical protein
MPYRLAGQLRPPVRQPRAQLSEQPVVGVAEDDLADGKLGNGDADAGYRQVDGLLGVEALQRLDHLSEQAIGRFSVAVVHREDDRHHATSNELRGELLAPLASRSERSRILDKFQ